MGKTIEVFTDSSRFSDDFGNFVKEHACPKCSIITYDANNPDHQPMMESKTAAYGVTKLPAVTMDGKLVPVDKLKKGKLSTVVRNLLHHRSS